MPSTKLRSPGTWGIAAMAMVTVGLVAACAHRDTRAGAPPGPRVVRAAAVTCNGNGVTPDLNCPELPNTNAVGRWVQADGVTPGSQGSGYLDFDLWAWNSFIAVNWPALDPATNNNRRGLPDTTSSFATARPSDTVVWETFKEKREVFLYDYRAMPPGPSSQVPLPWSSAPQYGPTNSPVPCCPGAVCTSTAFERHLGSTSKFRFNTLDENVEVPSEALETRQVLCGGWVNPATQCSQLGQNTCCTLSGQPVMPRVWKGNPFPASGGAKPVLYEVKLNYDSFQYILNNKFYDMATVRQFVPSSNGPVTLPARTSAAFMPPPPGTGSFPTMASQAGPNPGVTNYSASSCLSSSVTPCPAGAVHLKAAWIELTNEDATKYHTASAYKYLSNAGVPGGICKQPATFGLIGLHIIQRVHVNNPAHVSQGTDGAQGFPRGGTYVFASWEHVTNDTAGFTYANYSSAPPTGQPGKPAPFPNVAAVSALPLNRAYSLLPSTARANALIYGQLGCPASNSVWCNYMLIGTQYAATELPSPEPPQLNALPTRPSPGVEAPAGSGQPYYMANLVIESNVGLQQFQGLPISAAPGVITVLPHWLNVGSKFSDVFQRGAANLAFRTQSIAGSHPRSMEFNMGGCMGCHGVAQLSGYSFSFVLLDNQAGAVPDVSQ